MSTPVTFSISRQSFLEVGPPSTVASAKIPFTMSTPCFSTSDRASKVANAYRAASRLVSEAIGVHAPVISSWERGHSEPLAGKIPVLADLYGVTADWILGRESAAQTVMEEAELALRGAATELTEEEMQSVADFIQFVRRQKRDKGN